MEFDLDMDAMKTLSPAHNCGLFPSIQVQFRWPTARIFAWTL